MTLLAIDLGIDPGFAILFDDCALLLVSEFPVAGDKPSHRLMLARVGEIATQFRIDRAAVEDVGPTPKQGISSTSCFGRATGLEGAMMALRVSLAFVRPNVRKKRYGANGAAKNGMWALAAQRWPKRQEALERVKDQRRAEAALLGLRFLENRNG